MKLWKYSHLAWHIALKATKVKTNAGSTPAASAQIGNIMDLLLWFDYNDAGEIYRLVRIQAVDDRFSLDDYFEEFFNPPYSGGGVHRAVKEHIVTPNTLMGVYGTAYVLYVGDKRFRAVLPYYTVLT